jgi:hypothetical protein
MEEVVPLNTVEVVDPDVRSHVYSLVTAVRISGFS